MQATQHAPKKGRKVYLTIFAGRQRYLSILKRYLDYLLEKGSLAEVHVWDFARNPADSAYLVTLCQSPGYRMFRPDRTAYPQSTWASYYQHFIDTREFSPEDVIVKCDDDVVFIDVRKFDRFIGEVDEGTLYFPNIVNNDVCAHIQSLNGIHDFLPRVDPARTVRGCGDPLTDWYTRHAAAADIHRHFLSNVAAYSLEEEAPNVEWQSRISINMFAATVATFKRSCALFKSVGGFDDYERDERFLSGELCRHLERPNIIVPYFNVVHFSYGLQDPDRLDAAFLAKYDALSIDMTVAAPPPSPPPPPAERRRHLLFDGHTTQCPTVAGYLDLVQANILSTSARETSTRWLWQVHLVGWAFPLDSAAGWRPVRFHDAKSGTFVELEAVRRDDVAAVYGGDSALAWCGWDQTVACYGNPGEGPTGELQMNLEGGGGWTVFAEVHVEHHNVRPVNETPPPMLQCAGDAADTHNRSMSWATVPLLCINLDRRPERLAAMEVELARLGRVFDSAAAPTVRVQAVSNPADGALGCSLSHLRCVEMAIALDWPAVAILEDDFECVDPAAFVRATDAFMRAAVNAPSHWDMFMLGTNVFKADPAPEFGAGVLRVRSSICAEGYIVNAPYLAAWRSNLLAGIRQLAQQPHLRYKYTLDVHWHELQERDAWFMCHPPTVVQAPGFSDTDLTMHDWRRTI